MATLTKLHQVAVHSSDLERSIAFFRAQLGAQLSARFDPPGLAFFKFGETRILLEKNAPRRAPSTATTRGCSGRPAPRSGWPFFATRTTTSWPSPPRSTGADQITLRGAR